MFPFKGAYPSIAPFRNTMTILIKTLLITLINVTLLKCFLFTIISKVKVKYVLSNGIVSNANHIKGLKYSQHIKPL